MKQLYSVKVKQFKKNSCPYWGNPDVVMEDFYVEAPSAENAIRKAVAAYRKNGTMRKDFRNYTTPGATEVEWLAETVLR